MSAPTLHAGGRVELWHGDNETQAQRHPRESGHALIPLSAQQAEAWARGGCIVTIFTARGIGKRACGEPVVDGRLCAGHAAEKARLA